MKTCESCKQTVNRVYQYNLCRDCLVTRIQSLRPMLNYYRDMQNFQTVKQSTPIIPIESYDTAGTPEAKHLWLA